jgi:hypothetical protein
VLVAAAAVASVGPWHAAPVLALALAALCALPGSAALAGLAALTVAYEGCGLAVVVFAVVGALYVIRAGTVRSRAARAQRAAAEDAATGRRAPDGRRLGWLALPDALAGLALLTAGALTAARPHGWWLTVCAVAVCVFGAVDRRNAYATPQPVLRALAVQDEDDRLWVFAADDTAGRRPLFSCAAPAGALAGPGCERPAADGGADADADDDAAADDDALGGRPGPREVLLVGAPVAGERLWVVPGSRVGGFRTGRVRSARREPASVPRASTFPNDGLPV